MFDFLEHRVVLDNFDNSFVFGFVLVLGIWAKSISTGIILVGAYINKKYSNMRLREGILAISILFLLVTLLTLFDNLHSFSKIYMIFRSPNFTSPLTIGVFSIISTLLILFSMILFLKHQIFNRLLIFAFFCSVPLAFYTAFAISISNFSIYNMPLELMHFSFNSFALGSSFILFFVDRDDIKFLVAKVLLCSILVLFFIHISSYMFADMNSLEISQMIAPIKMHGEYFNIFWITISFSFITPMFLITLSLVNKSANILPLASLLSISGILLLEYIYIVLI